MFTLQRQSRHVEVWDGRSRNGLLAAGAGGAGGGAVASPPAAAGQIATPAGHGAQPSAVAGAGVAPPARLGVAGAERAASPAGLDTEALRRLVALAGEARDGLVEQQPAH